MLLSKTASRPEVVIDIISTFPTSINPSNSIFRSSLLIKFDPREMNEVLLDAP